MELLITKQGAKMNLTNKVLSAVVLAGVFLTGCTKDRQQKEVLKYEVYSKSGGNSVDVDPTAEYLYSPSTLSSDRKASFGRAYWLGEGRIVTMELGEFALNLYTVDKETKFAGNPSNKRLVMSIPVDHVDYRCADDAFGECTNEQVVDDRIPWNKKKFYRPHFDEAVLTDPNSLPGDLPDDCYDAKKTKLVGTPSIDNISMNFRLERSYQNKLEFYCIRGLENLEDLNWSEVTQYSIVRLDKVVTPDYQKAVYHPDWINKYGFFEENDYHLDIDGNLNQDGQTKYITRWNPARNDVVYHMTDAFNKPENQMIKSATYESFKRINVGLEQAGVGFRLVLKEPDSSVDTGDLRNNMIILAEDPFEASVIGYGPSVSNPRTGEIISARTVMYSGSLKKFIRYTYDEILLADKKAKFAKSGAASTLTPAPVATATAPSVNGVMMPVENTQISSTELASMASMNPLIIGSPIQQIDRNQHVTDDDMARGEEAAARRDQIAQLSGQCWYPAEVQFGDVTQEVISDVVKGLGELKPWENLTTEQRQNVIDTLVPYVWIPTLVHEIGHNLGLRHNFSGSEDKANFYTSDELLQLHVPVSTKNVPYSSVMDYPKSEINALRNYGKYDVAALRFGYRGLAETPAGDLIAVDSSAPAPTGLKDHQYCSDEGIALNPNCNPFDEGSGFVEIAKNLIDSYNDTYLRSNFRRGRANFSSYDDDLYLGRLNRTFSKMRLMFERYQDIVEMFNVTQPQIDSVEWLKDLDQAVEISGDFLMSVIAEPATHCAVRTPLSLVQVVPLGMFGDYNTSCYDLQLNTGYTIVGQGGKTISNYKLPTNPNRYADQIDVRGQWINKASAMRALFRRQLGNSLQDKYNGNFMDHPKVAAKLLPFLSNLLKDANTATLNIEAPTGEITTRNIAYSMSGVSYSVRAPDLPIVNRALNIRYDNMNLVEALASIAINGINEGASSEGSLALQQALGVTTANPNSDEFQAVNVGKTLLYVHPANSVAFEVLTNLQSSRAFESAAPASLTKVENLLKAKTPAPADLTLDELTMYTAGLTKLTAFKNGVMTPSSFYEPVLLKLSGHHTTYR
jgi:hypothetical protein